MLEAEVDEGLGGRQDELDLGDLGGDAQNVDVALGELPEATLLRALGPPDRADLDRLEAGRAARLDCGRSTAPGAP